MWVDFHSHVLPGIDDGAKDAKEASFMLRCMEGQQVERIFATPHYYAHRETIESFVKRRQQSYIELTEKDPLSKATALHMAAEVALGPEICRMDLTPLFYEGLSAILLELPASNYKSWMLQEIEEISYSFSAIPVLAHFERYLWYKQEGIQELLQLPKVVIQVSANMLADRETVNLLKELYSLQIPIILGSDAHNCEDRPPCFDIVQKVFQKRKNRKLGNWIERSTQKILYE